jgi:hypothetical protein
MRHNNYAGDPLMSNEDQPQFVPSEGSIIQPEDMTDEMLENVGPFLIAKFAANWLENLKRLKEEAKAAAMDDDALKIIRQKLKDDECWISRWSKRVGTRLGADVSENLKELECLFRQAGDDLLEALNTPPEERDPADWWKDDPNNPPPWSGQ